jgi:hypothetical protein
MPLPWWIADTRWNPGWSKEERYALAAAWLMFIPAFLVFYAPACLVQNAFGIDRHVGAVIALTLVLIPVFWLDSQVCSWLWPALFRTAAENAARRRRADDRDVIRTGIPLNVPFPQNETARLLGALWDKRGRRWIAPREVDLAPFRDRGWCA